MVKFWILIGWKNFDQKVIVLFFFDLRSFAFSLEICFP